MYAAKIHNWRNYNLQIYCKKNFKAQQKFSKYNFRYADHAAVGDEVLTKGNDALTLGKIINESTFIMQGDHIHYSYFLWHISSFLCTSNVSLTFTTKVVI